MKGSWKIGNFAGIDVRIHGTFLILLGWVGLSYWFAEKTIAAVAAGVAFILGLFACVVLHEFGHALTARRFGVVTQDITLLPIGGIARLDRMPEKPGEEFQVAIAGPLVNVAIAIVLYAVLLLTNGWQPVAQLSVVSGSFLQRMLLANVSLFVFNLVPAFPMDGGRILRALLASRMSYARATEVAASVGQGLAFVLGFIGLFTNPFLVFIALFVWIGAAQEASAVQMKSVMSGRSIREAMLTKYSTLQRADTLGDAAHQILEGSQQDFPVVENGRVVGVLTRSDLLRGLAQHGRDYYVSAAMQREFPVAQDSDTLEEALRRLQGSASPIMPVLHGDELVGMLTMENVTEYFLIQQAVERSSEPATYP